MKYKRFTSAKYVYFYDSESKWFPYCYKHVQYNNKRNVCYEVIYERIFGNITLTIDMDMFKAKDSCYKITKYINGCTSKIYYFNDELELTDIIEYK